MSRTESTESAKTLWLVVKEDTVLQATGYLVRATNAEAAVAFVNDGRYIEETKTETLDTLSSHTASVTEIADIGAGQQR